MLTGNGENPQIYGQSTVQDSQNGLCAKSLPRQRVLSAWIPGLLTLKNRVTATLRSLHLTAIQFPSTIAIILAYFHVTNNIVMNYVCIPIPTLYEIKICCLKTHPHL